MPLNRTCPQCGTVLSEGAAQGLCPACLLQRGMGDATLDSSEPGASVISTPTIRYFGDYELLDEIARGGMGVVFKARQVKLNRTVAIKMILAGTLADEAAIKRFHTEAEAAANLQHPNIVAIHEVGEHDGQQYFSMDFITGQNLAQLAGGKPLPGQRAAQYLLTIATAVQFAHVRGIVHRDLKPQNVIVDERDQPRITDFGLAKRVGEDSGVTKSGAVMGSPNYMAPEQALGQQERVGIASDVYALGAILYEMLTGRPPFLAATAVETMHQVVHTEPAPPRHVNPAVPADLETICLKCLEKESFRRYASAQQVADECARFLRGEPILARPVGPVSRAVKWAKRRPAVAALTGAVAALLVALAIGSTIAAIRIAAARDKEVIARNQAIASRNEAVAARNEAVASAERAQDTLARSLFEQARTMRASERMGRRAEALTLLGDATRLAIRNRPTGVAGAASVPTRAELRTESLAALLLNDATLAREVQIGNLGMSLGLSADGRFASGTWMENFNFEKLQKGDIGGLKGGVRVVELATGGEVMRISDVMMADAAVALSGDGKQLVATVTRDISGRTIGREMKLWNLPTSKASRTLAWPADETKSNPYAQPRLAFSPTGAHVAALRSGDEADVVLWDLKSGAGRVLARGKYVGGWPVFSADGERVALTTATNSVTLFDTASGAKTNELKFALTLLGAPAFSPDGRRLAVPGGSLSSDEHAIVIWDLAKNAEALRIPAESRAFLGVVEFSPDGTRLAFGDGTEVKVFDFAAGRVTLRIPQAHKNGVRAVRWQRDGQRLVTVGIEGTLKVWEFPAAPPVTSLSAATGPSQFAYSPDGEWLALSQHRTLQLIRRATGRVEHEWKLEAGSLNTDFSKLSIDAMTALQSMAVTMLFSGDSTKLAVAQLDRIVVWDTRSGAELKRVIGGGQMLSALAIRADGHLLASRIGAKTLNVEDLSAGKEIWKTADSSQSGMFTVLSDDGRFAAVLPGFIKRAPVAVWDVAANRKIVEFATDQTMMSVSGGFSSDNKRLAVIYATTPFTSSGASVTNQPSAKPGEHGIIIWPLAEPTHRAQYPDAMAAEFSADGRLLALGYRDGTVELRDAATGAELFRWTAAAQTLSRLAFTPDNAAITISDGINRPQTLDLTAVRREMAKLGLEW